ncbi:MAG TPA: DinB family protein [Propionibacteriaceae bacterium]|nr:DinB family protein [Propionibacteriaceae bacterium]
MSEPLAPPPEDRDWTYVITLGCTECGFTPFDPTLAADRLRATLPRWREALARASVRARPAPMTWSPLEYACHVRDVNRTMDGRLKLMLAEDGARFDNWDQDATAVEDRYWEQDPLVVGDELAAATEAAVSTLESVPDDAWQRHGFRSNGSEFTVGTLAVYFVHDVEHHLHDVGA